MKKLGKLSQVDLRKFWDNEAQDFTPWLAQEENLELLGQAINMELELEKQEYLLPESNFKVDILAKRTVEEEEEHYVVIENQLEKTDHKHLGQLLTYASGLEAKAVVWIAKTFNDEHKKALDWLNENHSNIAFFGLEIELWKIGDSLLAPKFNVVSKPNNWFKTVQSQIQRKNLSDRQLLQHEFWTGFNEYLEEQNSNLSLKKSQPKHWVDISMDNSDYWLCFTVSSQKKQLSSKFIIRKKSQSFFKLKEQKDLIEKELNAKLEWKELSDRHHISQYKSGDFQNREEWPQLFAWLKERAEAFHKTFQKQIKDLDQEDKKVA